MKSLRIFLWALLWSGGSLLGMKPKTIADLKVEHKMVKSLKTGHGMRIDEHVFSFTHKTTGNYVAGITYFVFDYSESLNKEQDKEKIGDLVGFISPLGSIENALYAEKMYDIGTTLDENRLEVKAYIMKKRKHGDVRYAFKKYVLPFLRPTSTVVFVHTLSLMRDYQVGGLGKQIMGYMFFEFLEHYPDSVSFWTAHPFNQSSKNKMSFSDLETFYKQCGCTVVQDGSGFCYVDITKFNLGFFKPKKRLTVVEVQQSKL